MTDLVMHNVTLNSEDGALLFLADTVQEADDFLFRFISTLFSPGERANTTLTVDSSGDGYFLYQADSGDNYAEIHLSGISVETAKFVRKSIERRGALLMVFGGMEHGVITLLEPRANNLFRAYGVIDGVPVRGQGKPVVEDILEALDGFPSRASSRNEDELP